MRRNEIAIFTHKSDAGVCIFTVGWFNTQSAELVFEWDRPGVRVGCVAVGTMTQVGGGGAPPPQANAASPFTYIGRPISLISKSQIRYEGILFTIDTNESTVALRNVRSFGTEGRNRPEGSVPPVNSVYDYVIFRGADILDLQVLNPVQFPQHPPVQPYHDPAIVARSNVAPRVPSQQPTTSSIPISQPQAPLNHAYPPSVPVPPAQNVAPQVPAALGNGVRQGSTPHMSHANGVSQVSAPLTSTPQAPPPPPYSAPQQTNVSAPISAQPSDAVTSRAPDVKLEPSKVPVSQPPQVQPALRPLPASSTGSTAVNTSAPQPALQPLQQTSKTGLRPLPQGVSAPSPAAAAAITNAKPALRPLQQPTSGGSAPAQPPYKGWGPPPQLRTWGPPAAGGRKEQNARPARRAPTANASGTAAATTAAAPPPAPGSTRRGGRGGRRKTRKGPGIEVPTEDFDFETMHTKFDKVSMEDQAEAIAGMPAIAEPYDKSRGFFDQLVPEKEMPRQRPNAAQRRAADIETFGEVGNVHSRNHRYRTSRGRRGGRNRSRNNSNQAPQAQAPPQQTN